MKYSNNRQYRKFEKQVNHLSGFIGMPVWNGRNPSLSEIREYDRRVLEKQALGFEPERNSLLKRLFVWTSSAASKAFGKTVKVAVTITEKKSSIKTNPECC